ncbi:BLUF domain-containing protein [Ekhidna sp.]|uniref:BLUF domain-containing protein n=1 Tax=Ekhidna sp. TaxID=2608089 RepID=UPI003BAAA2C1
MVFYLIYTSKPRVPMTPEVVEDITKASIRNNLRDDITGMLLAIEGHYLQFLEGNEKKVLALLEIIKSDVRHKDLIVWVMGFQEKRIFTEWSMGSWMLSNDELTKLSALDDISGFIKNPQNADMQSIKFLSMMNSLLKTWIAHEPERSKKLREGMSN